jgi:hypothetical protein
LLFLVVSVVGIAVVDADEIAEIVGFGSFSLLIGSPIVGIIMPAVAVPRRRSCG